MTIGVRRGALIECRQPSAVEIYRRLRENLGPSHAVHTLISHIAVQAFCERQEPTFEVGEMDLAGVLIAAASEPGNDVHHLRHAHEEALSANRISPRFSL